MKPIRMCVACRNKKEKQDLLRIVADDSKNAIYDRSQEYNERAIYFCNSLKCINKTLKIIEKNKFKVKISIDHSSLYTVLNEVKKELGE